MSKLLRQISMVVLAIAAAGCEDSSKKAADYLASAQAKIQSGDTDKARVDLERALAIKPYDPTANLALAKIEDADNDLDAAIPHYVRAAAPEAHLLDAQLRVAEILVDLDRFPDALGRINLILGSFPANNAALALRADIEARQGAVVQARADFSDVLQRDPYNARALAVAALLRLQAKDNDQALALVDKGLGRAPNNLQLLQVKAAIMMTIDQPDKAVDAFKSIARAAPRNVAARQALAALQAQTGHADEALRSLQDAVSLDPSNEQMQLALVRFLVSQKKDVDAVAYLGDLIRNNPKQDGYDLVLAEYYRGRNQIEKSEDVLRQAAARLKDTPEGRQIQVAIAKVELTAHRPGPAIDLLNTVIAKDPGNAEALLTRANLFLQSGHAADAITDLLAVVRNDPVNSRAFETLASAYRLQGDAKLADDAMRRAIAVLPGDDDAELRLAAFLQRDHVLGAAEDIMTRMTLRRPNSVLVWSANAQLAIDRKDWNTANRSVQRLQELPDGKLAALDMDGRLKAAKGDDRGAAASLRALLVQSDNPESDAIGAYAVTSAKTDQANDAIALLQSRIPQWKGDDLETAWLAIMSLDATAGHFDQVDAAFREATKAAPQSLRPYLSYVAFLTVQKDPAKALAVIQDGLKAGAPKVPLLLRLGGLQEEQGNMAGALASYKEASAIDPLSVGAANNYASILADQDPKNTEALTKARQSLGALDSTSDPAYADTIAWLDYRLGHVEEAKTLLTRINAAASDDPQIRFHMAAVLLANGDRSGGLALLESVKGLSFPGSDEIRALSAT